MLNLQTEVIDVHVDAPLLLWYNRLCLCPKGIMKVRRTEQLIDPSSCGASFRLRMGGFFFFGNIWNSLRLRKTEHTVANCKDHPERRKTKKKYKASKLVFSYEPFSSVKSEGYSAIFPCILHLVNTWFSIPRLHNWHNSEHLARFQFDKFHHWHVQGYEKTGYDR